MFSLELPQKTYHFQYKKKITRNIPNTIMSAAMVFCMLRTREHENMFEIAMVKESSVLDCIVFATDNNPIRSLEIQRFQ